MASNSRSPGCGSERRQLYRGCSFHITIVVPVLQERGLPLAHAECRVRTGLAAFELGPCHGKFETLQLPGHWGIAPSAADPTLEFWYLEGAPAAMRDWLGCHPP